MDQQLESIEEEENAHEGESRWQKIFGSHILLGVQVETWEKPDDEDGELQENNISIVALVVRNFAGSSNSPGEEWIGNNQIDEQSWKVPEP